MDRKEWRIGTQAILIYGLGILIIVVIIAGVGAKYDDMSSHFLPAHGTITKSTYTTHDDSDGNVQYYPKIVYAYVVNGLQYKNDRYNTDPSQSYTLNEAQKIISNYPVGSNITIYYNPHHPSDSLIVRGDPNDFTLVRAFFYTCIILIMLILLFSIPDIRLELMKRKITKIGMTNQIDVEKAYTYPEITPPVLNNLKHKYSTPLEFLNPSNSFVKKFKKYNYHGYFLGYFGCYVFMLLGLTIGQIPIYKFQSVFDLYDFPIISRNSFYAQLGLIYAVILVYLLNKTSGIYGKIAILIFSPFIVSLIIFGIAVLVITFPVLLLFILPIAIPFDLILVLIWTLVFHTVSLKIHLLLFSLSFLIATLTVPYIDYLYTSHSLIYSSFSKGSKHYNYAFSNGIHSITSLVCTENATIFGDIRGNITILNEYSLELPETISVHNNAVVCIQVFEDKLYSISTDSTLKITTLSGSKRLTTQVLQLNAIPSSLLVAKRIILIGTTMGEILQLKQGESITITREIAPTQSPIISLKISGGNVYFASNDDIYCIDLVSLNIIKKIKKENITLDDLDSYAKHIIALTDLEITENYIITSSIKGTIRITEISDDRKSIAINFGKKNEGIVSLVVHQDTIFAGSTDGKLYKFPLSKIYLDSDQIMKQVVTYDIHNYWINDLKIHNDSLYSVSSDGTLKLMYLKENMDFHQMGLAMIPIAICSVLSDCEICKLEILPEEKSEECSNCNTKYHLDHLKTYLKVQEQRNRPKECVVCKNPITKSTMRF